MLLKVADLVVGLVEGLRVELRKTLVQLQSAQEGPVLRLHIVGEHFDCEEAHAILSVEKFKFSLDHDVERFEEEGVEIGLDLLLRLRLFELFELLRVHSYTKPG